MSILLTKILMALMTLSSIAFVALGYHKLEPMLFQTGLILLLANIFMYGLLFTEGKIKTVSNVLLVLTIGLGLIYSKEDPNYQGFVPNYRMDMSLPWPYGLTLEHYKTDGMSAAIDGINELKLYTIESIANNKSFVNDAIDEIGKEAESISPTFGTAYKSQMEVLKYMFGFDEAEQP